MTGWVRRWPERQHTVAVLRWQQDMKQTEIAACCRQRRIGSEL
jgi:DNA-directed RNA polymerase specialized sigma subunit